MVESGFGGTSLLDPEKILRNELQLGAKSRVADLGCGTMGYFTLAAARLVGREGLVYAIDVLKDVLSSVASRASLENLDNVKTVWSNLEIPEATQIPVKVDAVFIGDGAFQNKIIRQS
jgi:precorrin-6B methylase 2